MVQLHWKSTRQSVLFLRRYLELFRNTYLILLFQLLVAAKSAAVPSFHALSGADNTGSFSGKVFNSADKISLLLLQTLKQQNTQMKIPERELRSLSAIYTSQIEAFVWWMS